MKKSHLIEPTAHWALPKPEIYRFMGFQGRVYYRFAGLFARSISTEALLNSPGINAQFQRNACPIANHASKAAVARTFSRTFTAK